MSEDEKGFVINDRRGAARDDATGTPPEAVTEKIEEAKDNGHTADAPGQFPPIDFISFISSLAATALMQLGEKVTADQPEMKDLAGAKQMIDLLELLQVKTKGNLEKEESDVLESILYNLRLRYVREATGKR